MVPQRIPRPEGARPGVGAWWSRPEAPRPASVPLNAVRAAFAPAASAPAASATDGVMADVATGGGVDLPGFDPRPAAVLCALFPDGDDTGLVLTRRSAALRSHTGQVSFPGGRLDPGETALQAALREAYEEVGIDPAAVEILGSLHALSTSTSGSMITPFVGVLAELPELRPNVAEVDRAFTVALGSLLAPGVYHEELWSTGGVTVEVHFFEIPGETVWGATARILRDLLDRVLEEPS